jgi:iron complex transport system substrate-binding protein
MMARLDHPGATRPSSRSRGRFFPSVLALLLLFALTTSTADAEIRLADDRGRMIRLDHPAERIATLAPHLAELAFAAGAGGRVVGVSRYSDFPPEAERLPIIGEAGRVNFEEIARFKPDLVLAWISGNRGADVARLEARGFNVFATEPKEPADVGRILRAIGKLAGTEGTAEKTARAIETRFADLRARYAGRAQVTVLYEIWGEPLMTVNGDHFISRLIELCGGRNVFAAALPLTPVISREQVLAADPDAIIVSAAPVEAPERLARWRERRTVRAVRADHLYLLDASTANRVGPRVLDGTVALCEMLESARATLR